VAEEKPLDPTPSRLARARREGDVPRSHDVTAVASLAAAACALGASLGVFASAARAAFLAAALRHDAPPLPYLVMAGSAAGVMLCAAAGALLATCAQAGLPGFKLPGVKFEKLDPVQGVRRMFSREAAFAGAKAFVVAGVVAVAAGACVRGSFASSPDLEPAVLGALATGVCVRSLAAALGVAMLFASGDVFFERAKWRRRLRMSFAEFKRDLKQSDGDPALRGKRRQAHRALARGSIGRLKAAAVVVTNPTHIAIALEYRPPEIAVPRVLVRAVDAGAREVRRRARALGIPLVENAALARSLLATTAAGDDIPPHAYGAVAAIVAGLLRANLPAS